MGATLDTARHHEWKHQRTRWTAMYRMRIKLVHHYMLTDPAILWGTLTTNIPQLWDQLDLGG